MATGKPAWTENVNLHTSGTVAAAATATDDIDLDNLGADAVFIVVEIVFGASPDGNVVVDILGSADSGTNDDTEPLQTFEIEFATSTTKRVGFALKDVPYTAVAVTNNDTTDNVTYDSWYAWRNWDIT